MATIILVMIIIYHCPDHPGKTCATDDKRRGRQFKRRARCVPDRMHNGGT